MGDLESNPSEGLGSYALAQQPVQDYATSLGYRNKCLTKPQPYISSLVFASPPT